MHKLLVMIAFLVIAVSDVWAVDPMGSRIAPIVDEGTAARDRKEWAAADAAYRRALEAAIAANNRMWTFRSWFYLGLLKQQEAEATPDEARKTELLELSREHYRTALTFNEKSTAARINLSQVEWFLGNREEAVSLLSAALAVGDDRKAMIAEELGTLHLDLGHRLEAVEAFQIATEKDPDSTTAHDKLLDALLGVPTRVCDFTPCHDSRDCKRCFVQHPFGGGCLVEGNDPGCEAAKASENARCQMEAAAAKADCERLKAQEKLTWELEKSARKALSEAGREALKGAPLGRDVTEYLALLLERKQVDRAIDGALRALELEDFPLADARGVRAILASALAKKDYDFDSFRAKGMSVVLEKLIARKPAHAASLQGIVSAYRGAIDDRGAFSVWADDEPILPGVPDSLSPLGAFRELLRSIATTSFRQLKKDRAIAYYELSLALSDTRIDAAAVRSLASIYAARGNLQTLFELDRRHEVAMRALLESPAEAEDVYEYFRLLGTVKAASLGPKITQADAIQEFEQAKMAGGENVEPQLHQKLGTLYGQSGQIEKYNMELLAAASAYMRRGNYSAARGVIAQLGYAPAGVDPNLYETAVNELVVLPPAISTKLRPEDQISMKRDLLLLVEQTSRAHRAKAANELEKLGITIDADERQFLFRDSTGSAVRGQFILPAGPAASIK